MPFFLLRSTTIDFLFLLFTCQKALVPPTIGPNCRRRSPRPGRSSFMTSAPNSANKVPMNGPAISSPSSRTRMPSSGRRFRRFADGLVIIGYSLEVLSKMHLCCQMRHSSSPSRGPMPTDITSHTDHLYACSAVQREGTSACVINAAAVRQKNDRNPIGQAKPNQQSRVQCIFAIQSMQAKHKIISLIGATERSAPKSNEPNLIMPFDYPLDRFALRPTACQTSLGRSWKSSVPRFTCYRVFALLSCRTD